MRCLSRVVTTVWLLVTWPFVVVRCLIHSAVGTTLVFATAVVETWSKE